MKISPVQGTGTPGAEVGAASTQRSNPDRIAAAKAIAAGQTPIRVERSENNIDPQARRAQESIRKIKMRTQVSPDRIEEEALAPIVPETQVQTQSGIPDAIEQTPGSEETKPLSPQFAALAKQRRALQVKEREIADREKAIQEKATTDGSPDMLARLKSDPLSVLSEAGVSYDQLTEAILNGSGPNPEMLALKAEIKALKEGVDKNFIDRDTQAEQQVLAEMRREADQLVATGDTYEMVRATRSQPQVIELIHRTYKQTGEVLDVSEALELVENDLLNENLKIANIPKLKSRLSPAQEIQQQQKPQGMRTLTSRDGANPQMSRRARAIAAMNGTLKR